MTTYTIRLETNPTIDSWRSLPIWKIVRNEQEALMKQLGVEVLSWDYAISNTALKWTIDATEPQLTTLALVASDFEIITDWGI